MARLAIAVLASLCLLWLALVVSLLIARPSGAALREIARLLPDTLRLLHRLARDPEVPVAARVRLWLLLAYLASPIDLIPDFIPVVGYVDDAILAGWVLRSVVRRAGVQALRRHWPGTEEGLAALRRAAGL